MAFKLPYMYDYITKFCRQQAEVIQNLKMKMFTTLVKANLDIGNIRGVLRRRDVAWRRIGALNGRYDWITKTLGVTSVDANSWIEIWDFSRDGLHINRSGARRLSQLCSRVCGFGGEQNSKE
jgi:hypothetical protein